MSKQSQSTADTNSQSDANLFFMQLSIACEDSRYIRYQRLREEQPAIRARNAAAALQLSEAELLDAQRGRGALLLSNEFEAILSEFYRLGEVLVITRNESVVHEKRGMYVKPTFFDMGRARMGLINQPDIDLRLFMRDWTSAFAVCEVTGRGLRYSIQFFDGAGDAVHKVYLLPRSDKAEFYALITQFAASEKVSLAPVKPYLAAKYASPDSVDWKSFDNDWRSMRDTHDFAAVLRKHNTSRAEAYPRVSNQLAQPIGSRLIRDVLGLAAQRQCPIMVFVGNRGCIQIHSGAVNKLLPSEGWFNVLDPGFNLHLHEGSIASAWLVRKPTDDGVVTSIELFDEKFEQIAQFFGVRKPGKPELALWRRIISEVCDVNCETDSLGLRQEQAIADV